MSLRAWSAFALPLALLVGCATTQPIRAPELSEHFPPKVELENVPFFPQAKYQCGPASLAAALAWSGVSVRPEDLVSLVYSPSRQGSLPTEMSSATRRYGRIAYPISTPPDLLVELAAGNPVVVLQNVGVDWYPQWHFAVAIGYDLLEEKVILHSGIEARHILSWSRFAYTWKGSGNWGLVVLPPSRLPATATERAFLESVVGLERSRQWEAAAQAYDAARERWPASLGALIGLGNSRYAMGDLLGAERAFRAATRAHPLATSAFNNLAHVLAEMGRQEEALAAARQAVALGGPLADVSRTTLLEIQAGEK